MTTFGSHRPACALRGAGRHARRAPFLAPLLAVLALAGPAAAAVSRQGDVIVNIASVGSTVDPGLVDSSPAVVRVRIPTRAALDLMEYAPGVPQSRPESMVPGGYRTGAAPGSPVAPLGAPRPVGAAAPIDLSQPVPLLATGFYHQGDPVFVRVTDPDQNMDRTVRDTVLVTITDDLTGDTEIVVLTEDGPDTGVFVGYLPTARTGAGVAGPYDGVLQVVEQSRLLARYADAADATDVLSAAALVDPLGLVFDSRSGLPVSGASVTVVDVATGQPATVFSDDGVSSYPATVTSGQTALDGAGRVHTFAPGEFRFPFLRPGSYRFDVRPPAGYAAPSRVADALLQTLLGAPYALTNPGSRGEAFAIVAGPAVRIDIPVDPASQSLWVQKTANKEVVGVGDSLTYEIAVSNMDRAAAAFSARAVDLLPAGFRYRRGSAQRDGAAAPDPSVSADGRTVTFELGDLAPSATATIRFLATVGAGTAVGSFATNLVTASTPAGATSNVGQASVRIADDFFASKSFILGRVTTGDCIAAEGVGDEGVGGVRIVLEDGTFAVSDRKGLFHFEGVRPGLHVVQLDLESLPEGWEPVSCTQNDRFAGRSFSQFVDVKGQIAWRADFHVRAPRREPPPPAGEAALELSHRIEGLTATFTLDARGANSPIVDARLVITIPENIAYVPGTSTIGGVTLPDPVVAKGELVYALGTLPPDWSRTLVFQANASEQARSGGGPVTATLTGAGVEAATAVLSADNALEVARDLVLRPIKVVIRPHFPSFGTALSPADKKQLEQLALQLGRTRPLHIAVTGHTDSVRIARRAQRLYKDNAALSFARARSVGEYLIKALRLSVDKLQVDGKGELEPIADNAGAGGRATNRRVEVSTFMAEPQEVTVLRTVKDKSGPRRTAVRLVHTGGPVSIAVATSVQAAVPAAPSLSAVAVPAVATAGTGEVAQASFGVVPASTFPVVGSAGPPPPAPRIEDGFLTPVDGDLLADRVGAVQVRAASHLAIHLFVDGKEVDAGRIGYKSQDHKTEKTLYTFVGVDFGDRGPHTLLLTATDPFGNERLHQEAHVLRTGEIAQIRFVSAEDNVADGRTPVRAHLELIDSQGNPIRGSVRLELREGSLSRLRRENENLTLDETLGRAVQMDRDGLVEFAPVSTSGSYRALLAIGNATVEVETWARPKMRDWILVGLAEGTVGYDIVSGNAESRAAAGAEDELYADGRVAFYAKGQIAGKWLITAAYDSAKQQQVGTSLFNQIDPQTYFTLYGDASQQAYDAASARKVYVKIEREQFYALFGDYDTGLTVTELSRYSRKMNGVKTELQTRNAEVNAFAARTDQTYAHDEIPGDGTSGLYRLANRFLTLNSETVTIVTRDRFRSELIVDRRTLTRFTDYSIDYDAGTIFFREPVPSRDFALNPVTIVVEYETQGLTSQDYTMGGRAGVKLLDQRLRAGVTVVHEGLGDRKNNLYGADARIDLATNTRLRGEFAMTDSRVQGVSNWGDAFLVELGHATRRLDARVYLREQQGGFGLGQQLLSETGTRKWGGDATFRFDDRLALSGQAYRQDTFGTGAERLFGEGRLGFETHRYGGYVGLLDAEDRLLDGSRHTSGQLTAGGRVLLLDERLTLALDYAQSVWGNDNVDFPSRIGARAEYKLTQNVSFLAGEEVSFGSTATTNNQRLGFRATPWTGGSLTSLVERDLNENDSRVFGNIGLRQTVQLSETWKVDAGMEHTQTVRHAAFYQPNPAVPTASGSVREDFTAATAGATYQEKSLIWDSRIEGRTSDSGDKWSILSGVVAERSSGWAFAGRAQYLGSRGPADLHTAAGDLRFGFVHRPARTDWILLSRLDWIFNRISGGTGLPTDSWRVVENFLANWRPKKAIQVALGYGGKYGRETAAGASVQGYTDEMGLELRYDVTESFDVGLRGSLLHVWALGQTAWSGGPEVGMSPATNVWLSLGFNVAGYEDRDFTASGYQARGPYLRLRFKFDQESVREAAAFLNRQ